MTKPFTETEQQGLEGFKAALQSLRGENLVSLRLFGSRARGDASEDSDIDVLVVVQKKDRKLCRRIVEKEGVAI